MTSVQIFTSQVGADDVRRRYRELLDSWPVPSQELIVPTRAGNTFVVASGPVDAPPLVLLHGSGSHSGTWLGDIATWSRRFRCYAVDMLGEPGGSDAVRLPLGTDDTASWLDEVFDALAIDDAAVVGMSLGGWTALDFTIRRPARVNRLAVLCPGGIGRQTMGWLPKVLLLRAFGKRGRRRTAQIVTGLDGDSAATVLDDVVRIFAHFKPRTERLPVFSDDDLRGISVPVGVIVGDRDVMMDSTETVRRAERFIDDSSVVVLPDTGHAIVGQTDTVMTFLTS
ncbi:alpha/beta fold hydrolase [Rhodococcoides kyotonense]|uniref:Pimeloyl-ACP methyl ester carboxylesterase n=1 Tax=Rhodococcoides kyotonense TaxID=398843 RepID=A0A239KHK5_9NOCA|nr:alpha/beta hydrolase [Rhodococcus kyotonensis]SNT17470.1 Pimeloyl-ACP methyl ester carboxylesterase [Rhodococcus kyotonensis]